MRSAYLKPAYFAVALETMKTMAGLSFFPPAPNIWSAAAFKRLLLSPTTALRLAVSCSISSRTGAKISDDDTVMLWP